MPGGVNPARGQLLAAASRLLLYSAGGRVGVVIIAGAKKETSEWEKEWSRAEPGLLVLTAGAAVAAACSAGLVWRCSHG